jgi:Flp pilus assembly pilin Flp
MRNRILRLTREENGQDLLEYALLASLIAAFVVGALSEVGKRINDILWTPIAQGF